jgi:hypothetical protein
LVLATGTPPSNISILLNGDFNGFANWEFSGTTQQNTDGYLHIAPTVPGGSFWQTLPYNSGGEIYEIQFYARNSSATTKTMNLMVRNTDWSIQYSCVFTIAPTSRIQYYTMRFDTTQSFSPMILQGILNGDSTLGLMIDGMTMVRKVGISVPSTECIVVPTGTVDLLYDGEFNQGTTNWAAFNANMQVVNIGGTNGNVMEIARNVNTPNGGFYQYNPYSAPANGVLRFSFQIGNQSNVARVINMLVRDPNWQDVHSCFVTVPAFTPLTELVIYLKTNRQWSNIVIQGWIQVGDYTGSGVRPFRFDKLRLSYIPSIFFTGTTECPPPFTIPATPTPTATPMPTLSSYGISLVSDGLQWDVIEATNILNGANRVADAFSRFQVFGNTLPDKFKTVMGSSLTFLRLAETQPVNSPYAVYYGTNAGNCEVWDPTVVIATIVVACRGYMRQTDTWITNGFVTEFAAVHELGHVVDIRSGIQLRTIVGSTNLFLGDCNVNTTYPEGERVMGVVSTWERGQRGWGSTDPDSGNGQEISQFQQNPYNQTDGVEAAADMFLNWVYRRTSDAAPTNIPLEFNPLGRDGPPVAACNYAISGSWLGFRNINRDGSDDTRRPGNVRYWWIEGTLQVIFRSQTWK